jgi:hypothetical protein
MGRPSVRLRLALALAAVVALAVVAAASAHIERASYWPDPAPDTSVSPAAGGKVPAVRSLYTALQKKPPGATHVVCQGKVPSTKRLTKLRRTLKRARKRHASRAKRRTLKRKIKKAKRTYKKRLVKNTSYRRLKDYVHTGHRAGYKLRPSEATRHISTKDGKRLLLFNQKLLAACKYKEIQPAATAARNNDRIVIMPGLYTEPTARAQPTHDPKCAGLEQQNDRQTDTGANQSGAVSYAYQVKCPNDQNLIAVMGRAVGPGADPQPPRDERRGIPNLGRCIRCNVQMEGSGVGPDDVIVDGGRVESGDQGPIGAKKDVGIRADRADGFVLRNVKVRHVAEHDIYVMEADGYVLERFKTYYAGEYGVLTFVEDHGLIRDCDSSGHGDSAIYPGAAAETGDQSVEGRRRYNQEIRNCDLRHSAAGYSGTAANGVWVHNNEFYDNALGFTTDVFTAAGHPGFPQDSDLIENNNFHSNNFNPYLKGSDVEPSIPVPVGTGLWIAGGNHNIIRNNHFWDNWRRGTMIFAVPDSTVCAPPEHQAGCDPGKVSTSFNNETYGNVMGRDPQGRRDPNGTDFWWDNFAGNTGNCWHDNTGKDGNQSSITSTPSPLPTACGSSASTGTGGPAQESELGACLADFSVQPGATGSCPWFTTPAQPQ